MNELFKKLHCARAAAAVTASRALAGLNHDGVRGQMREILVQDFLRPLLPPTLGMGTGVIVSADGRESTQQDLVIFDRSLAPPALVTGEHGVIPIDSVLFSIEVKSRLDATKLAAADRAAASLNGLNYVPRQPGAKIEGLIPCLFAFDSDLTQGTELERYLSISQSPPAIRAICVVGRGYWFFGASNQWEMGAIARERFEFAEMLDFVSGIVQTYDRVRNTRSNNLNPYFSTR